MAIVPGVYDFIVAESTPIKSREELSALQASWWSSLGNAKIGIPHVVYLFVQDNSGGAAAEECHILWKYKKRVIPFLWDSNSLSHPNQLDLLRSLQSNYEEGIALWFSHVFVRRRCSAELRRLMLVWSLLAGSVGACIGIALGSL
jgi:hypothetical protein